MEAGRLLAAHGIEFDLVYASWLSRSISTAWLVLEQLDALWLPIVKSWCARRRGRMAQGAWGLCRAGGGRWHRGLPSRARAPSRSRSTHSRARSLAFAQLALALAQTLARSLARSLFLCARSLALSLCVCARAGVSTSACTARSPPSPSGWSRPSARSASHRIASHAMQRHATPRNATRRNATPGAPLATGARQTRA
jgi:hypothetical protein